MGLKRAAATAANRCLRSRGIAVVRLSLVQDYALHAYETFDEYRGAQITANYEKLDNIWADSQTLDALANYAQEHVSLTDSSLGICHGSRNGFEQAYLRERLGVNVVGTDISPSATRFPHSLEWDFHVPRDEWLGRAAFVYSNSLDQSFQPDVAVRTWLDQLEPGGVLFIEWSDGHGPGATSAMDPFGARPRVLPYLLVSWFGSEISIEILRIAKANMDLDAHLLALRKVGEPTRVGTRQSPSNVYAFDP
jgi:hypothetical protein